MQLKSSTLAEPELRQAAMAGTILQAALAVLAHLSDWIALHALLFGGMLLSAIAGYLYAHKVEKGYLKGALGGAVAGGLCGLFGVATSVVLGDTDPGLLAQNTVIFTITGYVGGLFGQFATGRPNARI